jgi:ABC-type sugar transport system substrate-binding protein
MTQIISTIKKCNSSTTATICLILSLAIIALTSCTLFSEDKYVFVLVAINHPFWPFVKDGIQDAGFEKGARVEVLFLDQANKDDPNCTQAALSEKPKMIIMGGCPESAEVNCLGTAQRTGIKVADVFGFNSNAEANKKGVDLSFSLLLDNAKVGQCAAEYIACHKQSPDPKILLIEGPRAVFASYERVKGFKDELKKLVPKARIVASVPGIWDRKSGNAITTDTLKHTPDLNFIFALNDWMALGAVDAADAAGEGSKIAIIGVDGVREARDNVKAGLMAATITQLPYWVGRRAVEKAIEVEQTGSTEQTEYGPVLMLTKDVLLARKDPLLKYIR